MRRAITAAVALSANAYVRKSRSFANELSSSSGGGGPADAARCVQSVPARARRVEHDKHDGADV